LTPRTYAGHTPESLKEWFAHSKKLYDEGVRYLMPCTVLRITFPLDHPLAKSDACLTWIRSLRLVASGEFASGYAGYALNHHSNIGGVSQRLMNERLAALVLQHPGFDWHNTHYIVDRLLPFNPQTDTFLPLIKRTNWLCLLSERTIAHLGGRAHVTQLLTATPGIDVDDAASGIAIRAGSVPKTGDIPMGDTIPLFRSVAKVLRPVRMETLRGPGNGFPDDRAQAWLEAFD